MRASGVPHIIENFPTKAINFLQTSFQSKVYIKNYGFSKWQESQFQEFQDKNDIWV
jgi:hypothetical protein